jgi:hypothetical protein
MALNRTGGAAGTGSSSTTDSALADHLADATDAHDASAISFAPVGTIAASDVQTAIAEVATDYIAADAVVTAAHVAADVVVTDAFTAADALKAPLASPTFTGVPLSTTAAVGTDTTQIATTAFVQAARAYVHIREQQVTNTNGGSTVATTWTARVLTTEVTDTGNNATLSSNQITLAAGTYQCRARSPFFDVGGAKIRLRNVTAGATVLVGSTEFMSSADTSQLNAFLTGQFTIAAAQALELQYYAGALVATNGLGAALNSGEVEVYSEIEFWRVA